MRVALPAWRLLRPRAGVGNTLVQLLGHYARLAPEDQFTVLHDGPAADLPSASNLLARPVSVRPRQIENNLTWHHWALPRAVTAGAFDLVHNLSYTLPPRLRPPAVVTVHDVSYARHPEWYPARTAAFLRAGTCRAVAEAAALVTDSQAAAAEIMALFGCPASRIEVIPLAAEERFRPPGETAIAELRQRLALPDRFVFYLGGIHTRRRFDLLLQACAEVLPETEAQLVVAGPSGGEAVAGTVAELGLTQRVRQLGYVADDDLPALYAAATCFAWPSVYEGFGLPPLEAMACGTPTLVSDASSLPEVVGEAALRVPPDDLPAMVGGLRRLLTDEALRRQLAEAGPAQAAGFSWSATAEAYLAVYRRVICGTGR